MLTILMELAIHTVAYHSVATAMFPYQNTKQQQQQLQQQQNIHWLDLFGLMVASHPQLQ